LQRLEAIRNDRENQLEQYRRRVGGTEVGHKKIAEAERELTRINTEVDRLQTRISQQQNKELERRTPSAEVRDELLAQGIDPVQAIPAQRQAAIQSIQDRKLALKEEAELDKPLSTQDATRLGVPIGTTWRDAGKLARGELAPSQASLPPLTGEEAKSFQLGSRMQRGHQVVAALEAEGVTGTPFLNRLEQFTDKIKGPIGTVAAGGGGIGLGGLATPLLQQLRSEEERRYVAGQLLFIAGILRRESGAAITAEEYQQYSKIFFPQSGDDADTIAAKRALRQEEVAALQTQFPNRPFPAAPEAAMRVRPRAQREPGILTPRPSERPQPGQHGWPYQPGGAILD
jgi:hypothetical protein